MRFPSLDGQIILKKSSWFGFPPPPRCAWPSGGKLLHLLHGRLLKPSQGLNHYWYVGDTLLVTGLVWLCHFGVAADGETMARSDCSLGYKFWLVWVYYRYIQGGISASRSAGNTSAGRQSLPGRRKHLSYFKKIVVLSASFSRTKLCQNENSTWRTDEVPTML